MPTSSRPVPADCSTFFGAQWGPWISTVASVQAVIAQGAQLTETTINRHYLGLQYHARSVLRRMKQTTFDGVIRWNLIKHSF